MCILQEKVILVLNNTRVSKRLHNLNLCVNGHFKRNVKYYILCVAPYKVKNLCILVLYMASSSLQHKMWPTALLDWAGVTGVQ